MKLEELAAKIGARIVTDDAGTEVKVRRVYAGDKMSDLLSEASEETLLVTSLVGPQLVRLAQLMDVPAICLVKSAVPEPAMLQTAAEHGAAVMISPAGMYETCGRLYDCLGECNGKSE